MYNKNKHLIGKIGAICAIVLGGLILLGEVYNIVLMVKYDNSFTNWSFLWLFFSLIVRMIIGGMILAFGTSSLAKPTFFTSQQFGSFWLYAPRGKSIGLIVLGALRFVGGIINVIVYILLPKSLFTAYELDLIPIDMIVQVASIVLGLAIVVCKIVSMRMKDVPAQTEELSAEEDNA